MRRGVQCLCAKWLPKSVILCGSRRAIAEVTIGRNDRGRVSWGGLNHCWNARACPMCAAAMMTRRREDLLTMFRELAGDYTAIGAAFTLRHGIGDDPAKMFQLLSLADKLLWQRKRWRWAAKHYGYVGCVRITETTYSWVNGYHPHIHRVLVFRDRVDGANARTRSRDSAAKYGALGLIEGILQVEWIRAVQDAAKKLGLEVGLPDLEHGVTAQRIALEKGGEYLTKTGLVAELTSSETKSGRKDSRTMWQVVEDMVYDQAHGYTEHAADGEEVFRRYVLASKHYKAFFVSKSLKRIVQERAQLELFREELEARPVELLHEFSSEDFSLVRAAGPYAFEELEEIVESGGDGDAIRLYLARLLEHALAWAGDGVPFSGHDPPRSWELWRREDPVIGWDPAEMRLQLSGVLAA